MTAAAQLHTRHPLPPSPESHSPATSLVPGAHLPCQVPAPAPCHPPGGPSHTRPWRHSPSDTARPGLSNTATAVPTPSHNGGPASWHACTHQWPDEYRARCRDQPGNSRAKTRCRPPDCRWAGDDPSRRPSVTAAQRSAYRQSTWKARPARRTGRRRAARTVWKTPTPQCAYPPLPRAPGSCRWSAARCRSAGRIRSAWPRWCGGRPCCCGTGMKTSGHSPAVLRWKTAHR